MLNSHLYLDIKKCDGGITVSIAAFQAVDPGSTPGHRKYFFCTNQYSYSITIGISNI